MDWIITIGDSCLDTLIWMTALAIPFAGLALLMPCNRGMFWWKDLRGAFTDLFYWFLSPLIATVVRTVVLAAVIAFLFGAESPGFVVIRTMPIWLQCIAVLLIQDVMLYWIHRMFHRPIAWRFHAVHHSPKIVDWMSAGRNHVVNYLLSFLLADAVVQLLGFAPAAMLILAPFNVVYSSMVHANLSWTFGPLRYVFASPVFHRWHHAAEGEGIDKNFAPTFPFLDLLFGTFYMPAGKLPQQFGVVDHELPDDFWGQLIHPFTSSKNAVAPSQASTSEMAPQKAA